jgi:uncharacterized HAD superfamily protein
MMKKIIAVDADDTLFDETNAIRLFINHEYGLQHTEADYLVSAPYSGYWERLWQREPEQMRDMYNNFLSSSYKKNVKPIKDAFQALRKLKEKYELVVVTSRSNDLVDVTRDSLTMHYPNLFNDVHFVALWGNGQKVTKAKICNEIGASYLIDDYIEHCRLAAEANVQAILFGDYGWSRVQTLPRKVVRCKDWKAVERLLLS